jgi:hypothetical protein
VQLFYRMHVVSAAVFLAFSTIHWNGMYSSVLLGLIVYGMDVAYRWFQTRHLVSVKVEQSNGKHFISMAIPLQVRRRPC